MQTPIRQETETETEETETTIPITTITLIPIITIPIITIPITMIILAAMIQTVQTTIRAMKLQQQMKFLPKKIRSGARTVTACGFLMK